LQDWWPLWTREQIYTRSPEPLKQLVGCPAALPSHRGVAAP
jgi:hypothetical protein